MAKTEGTYIQVMYKNVLAIFNQFLTVFYDSKTENWGKMCISKVQHMTGRKTGCNQSRPVFFGFLTF